MLITQECFSYCSALLNIKVFSASHLFSQQVDWGYTGGWEELTPADQRDVLYHMAQCPAIKVRGKSLPELLYLGSAGGKQLWRTFLLHLLFPAFLLFLLFKLLLSQPMSFLGFALPIPSMRRMWMSGWVTLSCLTSLTHNSLIGPELLHVAALIWSITVMHF